jgi:hypothetical protein
MRRPKSLQKYQILRASQGLDSHYFSLGFHPFYTQFYTQSNADGMSRFGGKRAWDTGRNVFKQAAWYLGFLCVLVSASQRAALNVNGDGATETVSKLSFH